MRNSGIRQHILLLFSAAALIVALLLTLALRLSLWQADKARQHIEKDFTQAVHSLMTQKRENLQSWVKDYTVWDELFQFASSTDKEWARINLDSALSSFHCDHVWILNNEGKLVYHTTKTDRPAPKLSVPPVTFAQLQTMPPAEGLYGYSSGLWLDSMEVLELFAIPIFKSEDAERVGPRNGYMVVGVFVDARTTDTLSQYLGATLRLFYATPTITPTDEQQMDILYRLPPIEGDATDAGALLAQRNIADITQLKQAAFTVYGLSIIALLLLSAMLYWLIGRWVILPLRAISSALDNNSVEPLFQHIEHSNEIGRLAHLVIEFFRQRQLLTDEYRHQEKNLHALIESNEVLSEAANTDKLTGIANRRRFDEYLETQWQRNEWLGMILFDVDDFKRYNDEYGHVKGDNCLRQVAEIAAAAVQKQGDLLARFGGEEFSVLLPATDETGAYALAQRIHDAIGDAFIQHKTARAAPHITVSIGVASVKPSAGRNREILLAKADLALYQAKTNGRNRIEKASALRPAKQLERL